MYCRRTQHQRFFVFVQSLVVWKIPNPIPPGLGMSELFARRSTTRSSPCWGDGEHLLLDFDCDLSGSRAFDRGTVLCKAKSRRLDFYWSVLPVLQLLQVYDVSSYVNDHPGGEAILNNAGGENTKGFYGLSRFLLRVMVPQIAYHLKALASIVIEDHFAPVNRLDNVVKKQQLSRPQHPRWAYERIEEYYVGDIVQ